MQQPWLLRAAVKDNGLCTRSDAFIVVTTLLTPSYLLRHYERLSVISLLGLGQKRACTSPLHVLSALLCAFGAPNPERSTLSISTHRYESL